MIIRIWSGKVRTQDADAYLEYQLLRRTEGDVTEYIFITRWESYDAIRAFAGDDFEKAKYYPEDEKFLLEMTPKVLHYEELPL